jgi:hypothetical protein
MAEAMGTWAGYELIRRLSLSIRDREIVIDRTRAVRLRVRMGVHVVFFADRVGFNESQIASLATGASDDACWTEENDRLLMRRRLRGAAVVPCWDAARGIPDRNPTPRAWEAKS